MKKFLLNLVAVAVASTAYASSSALTSQSVAVHNVNSSALLADSTEASVAQKWSADTDLPGLGFEGLSDSYADYCYTVLCEDGITTLGLFYDGWSELSVTGINTVASEVTFPEYVTVDGEVLRLYCLGIHNAYVGLSDEMDWSGAPNLAKLDISFVQDVYETFANSTITDLYVDEDCRFYESINKSDVYLHLPYCTSRSSFYDYGFKRVLVGEEQPEYPIPSYSDWVIAGENEGEYFGIDLVNRNDSIFAVSEIFTSKDSVSLPVATAFTDGICNIQRLGISNSYSYYSTILCNNASNLRIVSIPETYNYIGINWNYEPVSDLYMQGDVVTSNWNLRSGMYVYVPKSYYDNFKNSTTWNNASILPNGWDFEWMTVNVGRKGEFAQTYIEMTDADWSKGVYVKVTGKLDATDLGNIKNLTNLMKLDLSEAEFEELPSSFLYNAQNLLEVVLPDFLTSIPYSAFGACYSLQRVKASGVTSVDNSAFSGCSRLVDFDISAVSVIGSSAFRSCSLFNPAKLSPDLKTLEQDAFSSSGITEVFVPEGIKNIESDVFSNCSRLRKVTLPNTITSIGYRSFGNCSNLVDINLPEGIASIDGYAFYGCKKLTELVLPSTLQSIGNNVLSGCSSLSSVKCKAIVPPATNGTFTSDVDLNHCTLYIAPFTIDAYRAAQDWDDFYIMKPLNEPVKNIYIRRPMTFDLLSEDNAVLQENPNMILDYSSSSSVGQLSAKGDGTLSAGIFSIYHKIYSRNYSSYYNSYDIRTTLINNAENMRADSVLCTAELEKNSWHFISFQYDVRMEDIFGLDNTDFVVRCYNSQNRASGDGTMSNWETVPADGILEAGKGYIIQAANNSKNASGSTYSARVCFPSRNTVTKNRLFTSHNVVVPLEEYPAEFTHNRSWNLVGNPYPCYYDMNYLMDDFITPITLWRGTSYQAYSPIDDDIILRPNEAFFVQRPLDAEQMVFGVGGRMHYADAYNASVTPGSKAATLRTERNRSSRSVFNFNIEGCGSDDRARIVMNEDASMEYELNRDASKFFAEVSEGAEIFVDGSVRYDICERPLADGIAVLGVRVAKDGEYTIALSGRSIEGWSVVLKDTQTGSVVDLAKESYQFDAKAGTSQNRFTLAFISPEETTIENIITSEGNAHVRVANMSGSVVFEGNVDEFKANAKSGVYVVVASEKAYKVVIE